MSSSTVQTETDKMSSFLRAGVASSDVASGSLTREHVARPEHHDFPMEMGRSTLQMLVGTTTRRDNRDWRKKRHRAIAFTNWLSTRGDWPIPGLAKTFYLPRRAYLEVYVWCSAFEIHNSQTQHTGAAGSRYTTTYSGDDVAGSLVLKSRDHSDNSFTSYPESRHQVCNNYNAVSDPPLLSHFRRVNLLCEMQLTAAGTYTIFAAYEHEGPAAAVSASDKAREVIIGNRGITIEPRWY